MRTLLLLFIVLSSGAAAQTGQYNYYLKAADSVKLSKPTIDTTVKILTRRLLKQGYKNSSVAYNRTVKQFVISGSDVVDTNFIKFWLTKPFSTYIYETYSIEDISAFVLSKKRTKRTIALQNEFLKLLHIDDEATLHHQLAYIGTLLLADTARFNKLKLELREHFPADLIFVYPKKLSSPKATYVEVYAVRNNSAKMNVNEALDTCASGVDEQGRANVRFTFNRTGQRFFSKLAADNINKALAIVIDDRVYSAPFVMSPVPGDKIELSGIFSVDETKEMTNIFLSGCLPAKLSWVR